MISLNDGSLSGERLMKTLYQDDTLQLPVLFIDIPLRMTPYLSAWFHVDLNGYNLLHKRSTGETVD